jgi:hypothetical protein
VPWALTALVVAVAALVWMVGRLVGLFPDFGNPFAEERVDRSGPVLLKSIRDIGQYRAANGHFEVLVDVEKNTPLVPSLIRGERVLFVAVGEVDAGVDLRGIGPGAVRTNDDRTEVTLTLPPARFYDARVDPAKSYVYDRDRGAVDRIASLFQDSPTSERELYVLAEEKLQQAAQQSSGLLRRAERNTRAMLTGMLRALGFERVTVNFDDPR